MRSAICLICLKSKICSHEKRIDYDEKANEYKYGVECLFALVN